MKKPLFCLATACLLLTFIPMQSIAQKQIDNETPSAVVAKPPVYIKPIEDKTTQQEFKGTDTRDNSNLTSTNRKNLQQSDERYERHQHGGIYISVGGALLIIFLLIVLL
jgi:phosphate-selective porin